MFAVQGRLTRADQPRSISKLVIALGTAARYDTAFALFFFQMVANCETKTSGRQVQKWIPIFVRFLSRFGLKVTTRESQVTPYPHFNINIRFSGDGAWRLVGAWQRNELPARAPPLTVRDM